MGHLEPRYKNEMKIIIQATHTYRYMNSWITTYIQNNKYIPIYMIILCLGEWLAFLAFSFVISSVTAQWHVTTSSRVLFQKRFFPFYILDISSQVPIIPMIIFHYNTEYLSINHKFLSFLLATTTQHRNLYSFVIFLNKISKA